MSLGALPQDFGPQFIDIGADRSSAVLLILDAGWQRVMERCAIDTHAGEVEITECLRAGMREALNDRIAAWCKKMTVLPGTESRSVSAALMPDGRTDIPIYFQDVREAYDMHDPHAIVECKRVAGNNAGLCRLYVVEGIDRFKVGKYAGQHVIAFMAGYVLAGGVGTVTTRINQYLAGQGRGVERLTSCTVLSEAWARSSSHPRPDPLAPIDLHHAFLRF